MPYSTIVTKDIPPPAPAPASPAASAGEVDRPLDQDSADMLMTVLNTIFGMDTTAFEKALESGQPDSQAEELGVLIYNLLFPDPAAPSVSKAWADLPLDEEPAQAPAPAVEQQQAVQPMNRVQANILVHFLSAMGGDVATFRQAVTGGNGNQQAEALAEVLSSVLWAAPKPDQVPAPAPAPAPAATRPTHYMPGAQTAAMNPGSGAEAGRLPGHTAKVRSNESAPVVARKASKAAATPALVLAGTNWQAGIARLFGHAAAQQRAASKAKTGPSAGKLDSLAQVTPSDNAAANSLWQASAPQPFKNLLDAKRVK